jgi:hypothetical protein
MNRANAGSDSLSNRLGTDGLEFVEYTVPVPDGATTKITWRNENFFVILSIPFFSRHPFRRDHASAT